MGDEAVWEVAMWFRDRAEAGRRVGEVVADLELRDPIVLGLPRGGIPVAYEVARTLGAPLEVLVARKVGAPGQPELGIGAVAEGGTAIVTRRSAAELGISEVELSRRFAAERQELARRVHRYRAGRPLPDLAARDVVIVDDGLATGGTAEAALRSVRALRGHDTASGPPTAHLLVLAVPVGAPETVARLTRFADHVTCLHQPRLFGAVGNFYDDFTQTTDAQVLALLARAGTQ